MLFSIMSNALSYGETTMGKYIFPCGGPTWVEAGVGEFMGVLVEVGVFVGVFVGVGLPEVSTVGVGVLELASIGVVVMVMVLVGVGVGVTPLPLWQTMVPESRVVPAMFTNSYVA